MSKKGYIFDKRLLFETREAAEAVLKELRYIRDVYKFVTVDTLYALMDLDQDKDNDDEFGWEKLNHAFVTYTSDGYRLCLPGQKKMEFVDPDDVLEDVERELQTIIPEI